MFPDPTSHSVSALTVSSRMPQGYSNEGEIPGLEHQLHFIDGVVVGERE